MRGRSAFSFARSFNCTRRSRLAAPRRSRRCPFNTRTSHVGSASGSRETFSRRQLDYWQSRLHEAETLTLPLDRPRPPHASFCGARIMRRLPAPLTASLRQLCGSENVTLFQLILTAFKVVLHRYSGQNDIVIGTPVTN